MDDQLAADPDYAGPAGDSDNSSGEETEYDDDGDYGDYNSEYTLDGGDVTTNADVSISRLWLFSTYHSAGRIFCWRCREHVPLRQHQILAKSGRLVDQHPEQCSV